MGLISKEIEIGLASGVIQYYEKLGYNIPRYYNKAKRKFVVKRGTKITVDINDIPLHSGIYVQVECDCCNKKYKMPYIKYNAKNKEGKIYCKDCKGILYSGERHYNWNPLLSDKDRIYKRDYPEYKKFVQIVLARDNYTCQFCNKIKDVEVHHLNGYNWFVEGRTNERNGITLCKNCHSNFHLEYGFGNNTKEQFKKWIGRTIYLKEKYSGDLPIAKKYIAMKKINCMIVQKILQVHMI